MIRTLAHALLVACVVVASGCSTVTIRDKSTARIGTDPTWEDSKPFFFWGLAGTGHVDVKEICGGRGARQLQAQNTFLDSFLAFLTIGIYSPRTAKVWCEKTDSKGGAT